MFILAAMVAETTETCGSLKLQSGKKFRLQEFIANLITLRDI